MQSTLYYTPSNSPNFPLSWKSIRNPVSRTPRFSSKILTLTDSLRTQITVELEEGPNDSSAPSKPAQLPILIQRYGKVSRYFWDGNRIQLLSVGGDGGAASSFCFDFGKVVEVSFLAVRNIFIPKQVSENYMGYVKWRFLHRVFSSALQVLATQAMFRAIGIGYSRAFPAAAALNWLLKDGLGRLSRCIYTASFSSAFDTNLKRVRFSTSLLFTLSIGVELLTPVFPQHFLLLASLANIAKQMSLACYMATSSAIHQSFAIADNLAEVSAKAQIQSVCFDNLGLMFAAALNMLLKNNQRLQAGLPFILYPFFSAIDLFGIHKGLKHVHLRTLTKERLEIILDAWIANRCVLSPKEVSKEEDISFMWGKGKEPWRIRIGCLNPKGQLPKLSMMAMQSVGNKDYYFICMEIFYNRLTGTREQGILLCLHEGACTADVIMGLLQACYIRKALHSISWDGMMMTSDPSDSFIKEWLKLIQDSKRYVRQEFPLLNVQMAALGWAVKNILLNSEEQARYNYIND